MTFKKIAKTKKPKLPAPPAHLSDEAAKIWREVVAFLAQNGRLEAIDGAVIESFAMALTRQRMLQRELDKTGAFAEDGKLNPILRCIESAAATVQNFSRALGLSPAARKSLPVIQKVEKVKGPWSGILE